MRIISLLPSATEIVCTLGLADALVGVTYECDHPVEVQGKPVVSTTALALDFGGHPRAPGEPGLPAAEIDRLVREQVERGEPLYTLDAELIRRLAPDLILTQDLCRVCAVPSGQVQEALDKLGTSAEVVSLEPHTIDDILAGISEVGGRAGVAERAEAVVDGLRRRIVAVEEAVRGRVRPRVVTLEWLDPPFAGGHWVPEMVERAGGEHLLAATGEPSRRVTWEDVARAQPEVVVAMPCGYRLEATQREAAAVLPGQPAVADSPARRSGRVFAVDASSFFSRPGPRVVDGLEIMAWMLHPDAVPVPPVGRVAEV